MEARRWTGVDQWLHARWRLGQPFVGTHVNWIAHEVAEREREHRGPKGDAERIASERHNTLSAGNVGSVSHQEEIPRWLVVRYRNTHKGYMLLNTETETTHGRALTRELAQRLARKLNNKKGRK